jgi:hypothetical protein
LLSYQSIFYLHCLNRAAKPNFGTETNVDPSKIIDATLSGTIKQFEYVINNFIPDVTDEIQYNGVLSLRNAGGLLQKFYGVHTNRKNMTGITEQSVYIGK